MKNMVDRVGHKFSTSTYGMKFRFQTVFKRQKVTMDEDIDSAE